MESKKPKIPEPEDLDPEEAEIDDGVQKRSDVADKLASQGYAGVLVTDPIELAKLSQEAAEIFERLHDSDISTTAVDEEAAQELILKGIVETTDDDKLTMRHKHIAAISSYGGR